MLSRVAAGGAVVLLLAGQSPANAQENCTAPDPVCDARAAVFGVSAFDPAGSAVRIGPDLLVTNRHNVADQTEIDIILPDGKRVKGEVLPTAYRGDLILVRATLPDGPVIKPVGEASGDLWTIGQDISERRIKVYPKGRRLLAPAENKPYARLHHTAYSQPGNSGGAVVDKNGNLVAVAASGGSGRYEAVPADQIERLQEISGPDKAEESAEIGKRLRECTLMVEKTQRIRGKLPDKMAEVLKTACEESENRQLYDLAGQVFGSQRRLDESIKFFERALERDPNAINSRLSLVSALRFARKSEDAKPHIRWLLNVIPEEQMVHPIALFVGKATDDQEMIDEALALIEKHAPNQLEAAKNFLKSPVR